LFASTSGNLAAGSHTRRTIDGVAGRSHKIRRDCATRNGSSVALLTIDMSTTRPNSFRERPRHKRRGVQRILVLSAVFLGNAVAQQAANTPADPFQPDTPGESHAASDLRVTGPNPDGWLYPITKLNEFLPHWLQFGGQFRDRLESQDGLGYAPVNDVYDLTQLRIGIYIQPMSWLKLVGVTQDSRVFFNHHVATAPPYQNIWDIREAYVELGSSNDG